MPASTMSSTSRSLLVLLFTLLTLFVNTLNVGAQRFTSTLPWIDGDTIIVSQSTNAAGVTVEIQTLSTLLPLTTTGLVRTTTTPGALVPTTTALVPTTTSIPLVATTTSVVVPTTTSSPVRVTTDPLDDETTTTSRRRSSTSIAIVATPTVAPGQVNPVPAGTIMDYSQYQESINQAAKTGGVNSALSGGTTNSAVGSKVDLGLGMGLTLTVVGGVMVGVVGLF